MKKSLGAKSLALPAPVWVVGSYDHQGNANFMTASWGGICCSKPPCVTVSLRKATYSFACIEEHKAFSISVPSEQHVKEADYFGIASGRDGNKCSTAGLSHEKSDLVSAPYITEFPLVIECTLFKTQELGLHTQFVGEILDVKADESVLDENGKIDLEKVKPFVFNPADRAYYKTGTLLAQGFSVGKELLGE